MERRLHVLLVEDSENDALLLVRSLQRSGYKLRVERVQTLAHLQTVLDDQPWDVIIADYTLPGFTALEALKLVQGSGLDIPFIVVSGSVGEGVAVATMKAGAHDYLMKNNLQRLDAAIEREIREAQVRRERRLAEQALQKERDLTAALMDTSGALVMVIKRDGSLVRFNRACEQTTGYTLAELQPQGWCEMLIPSEQQAGSQAVFAALLTGQAPLRYESDWMTRTGERRRIVWENTVLLDASNQVEYIVSTGLDITERIQAEGRIRRQRDYLDALRRIDLAITAKLDLHLTLDILLDQVTTQLRIDAAAVLLFNPRSRSLEYVAGCGFHSDAIQRFHINPGKCVAGYAEVEYVSATLLMAEEGFVSYYNVPLIARDQVKGVMELFHRTTLTPDQEWMDFMNALASQAAIAVDNAQLIESLRRSNEALTRAYDATIEGWARALELRDTETEGHSRRVTAMTLKLAGALQLGDEALVHIRRGALLHDIGKMAIPDAILMKPGQLTAEERSIMTQHPTHAYNLLAPIAFLQPALDIPYYHHERWDGLGYPHGLQGEAIPLAARIFAVVDVWDALRSDRPYRKGWPDDQVRDYIGEQAGSQFDPHIVSVFLRLLDTEGWDGGYTSSEVEASEIICTCPATPYELVKV